MQSKGKVGLTFMVLLSTNSYKMVQINRYELFERKIRSGSFQCRLIKPESNVNRSGKHLKDP